MRKHPPAVTFGRSFAHSLCRSFVRDTVRTYPPRRPSTSLSRKIIYEICSAVSNDPPKLFLCRARNALMKNFEFSMADSVESSILRTVPVFNRSRVLPSPVILLTAGGKEKSKFRDGEKKKNTRYSMEENKRTGRKEGRERVSSSLILVSLSLSFFPFLFPPLSSSLCKRCVPRSHRAS